MAKTPAQERIRKVLWIAGGIAATWFAVQGGEYGTVDLLRQSQARTRLAHEIDSLTKIVDSLIKYRQLVLNDPRTQERLAREEFGMIKNKELLYRIADPGKP